MNGYKYRKEHILAIGHIFPIKVEYFYNNQGNSERTQRGFMGRQISGVAPVNTVTPLTNTAFSTAYPSLTSGDVYRLPSGDKQRFWRHSYQDFLESGNGNLIWHKSNGQDIEFDSNFIAAAYPSIGIIPTTYPSPGHRIVDRSERKEYEFDVSGRLIKIFDQASRQSHAITYASNNFDIARISHSLGGYVDFTYENKEFSSSYILPTITQTEAYPAALVDSSGKEVRLAWDHTFQGLERTHYLLTRISHIASSSIIFSRTFKYGRTDFPASITEISELKAGETTPQLYAEFHYDNAGRAIYSTLNQGANAVKVAYPTELQRVVTNALSKQATYDFAIVNGVKRLVKVTGEPMGTCLKSETTYLHDAAGNVSETNSNGNITRFTHNSRGLETERIEAFGTPHQRTIQITWHPTFDLPIEVVNGNLRTIYSYDPDGNLLQRLESIVP